MPQPNCRVARMSLGPNALQRAGKAFDETWASIAANYSGSDVETVRTGLATIILCLSADGSRDLEQVKAAALEFFSPTPRRIESLH